MIHTINTVLQLTKTSVCYTIYITNDKTGGRMRSIKMLCRQNERWWSMIVEIDFNSEEALYIQLINQIIIGIATDQIREGDTLPSVRQLADNIGINMHTVNKAYSVLKQEGFLRVDRRRGAVIALDTDKMRAISEMRRDLGVILARGVCKNVSREEVHSLVDSIYDAFAAEP